MCKKIYLLLSIAVLILIIYYVYSSCKQNYQYENEFNILFKDVITYDDKTYFNLNGRLYSYDGKHIDLVIDSERDSEYCIVDNIIYCCCNYNDIISISKKGQNGIEIIYREDSLDKNLKNFFVSNDKIIYVTETYYTKIYNYMISGYSIYTMDTDGSNSKKIMDLPVNTEGRDKTTFMVDDEYVYYIQPETGDFWKIDFEGNKNEYITSDTQLSNNYDLFGVYEYNGKVYYVLPSVDDSGKFTGYNLYRADLDNQNRILLAEGLTSFRMIDNLLIYNQNVYDENNNFITGSVDIDGICGCDKDYIYFYCYDDNMTKHIYKYNINTCKIADITDDLYYKMLL